MNHKILEILDCALEVAEQSESAQKQVICALVELVNKIIESKIDNTQLARNYIQILRDGHNLPKHKIIILLSNLVNAGDVQ